MHSGVRSFCVRVVGFRVFAAVLSLSPALVMAQPDPPPAPPAPVVPRSTQMLKMAVWESRSFLGVGVKELDSQRAKDLNLKEEYGVEITRVEAASPAETAGLKTGDVVQEYNGQRVEGTEQFVRLVRETPAGRIVKLQVVRNGVSQTLTATLGVRKPKAPMAPMEGFHIETPDMEMMMPDIPKAMMSWRSSMLGIEAESLGESQLADFFGVKEGVLVRSVMKGTAAEKAGLKAGDVLLKVDESKVSAPRDVTGAVRSARSGSKKSFPIVLMRERKEMTVTVTMDDEQGSMPVPRRQKITVRQFRL